MTELTVLGERAKSAAAMLMSCSKERKRQALFAAAEALRTHTAEILLGNAEDLRLAKENGMEEGLLDRLLLTEQRILAMAEAVEAVALLPDPVGELLSEEKRPNGIIIRKQRVPIGVVGIIYEARPNVSSDAFSLCLKTGNAVILKGGSDALCSNSAIVSVLREALRSVSMDPDCIQLIESADRETTRAFMRMNRYVDVLIPRGSARLIQAVVEHASVPVLETGAGNCHIYLEETADEEKAVAIVRNAKTQRIGVCNACESLVVQRGAFPVLLSVARSLQEKNVSIMADPESCAFLKTAEGIEPALIFPASEEDFTTEYLDYRISVKTVESTGEAILHINACSTGHSECIVTEDSAQAEKFLQEIDSACVYWNASTRFTDGGEFGFGAEIGISTSRLHARGPMGLEALTSYKYLIYGNGQIRA